MITVTNMSFLVSLLCACCKTFSVTFLDNSDEGMLGDPTLQQLQLIVLCIMQHALSAYELSSACKSHTFPTPDENGNLSTLAQRYSQPWQERQKAASSCTYTLPFPHLISYNIIPSTLLLSHSFLFVDSSFPHTTQHQLISN